MLPSNSFAPADPWSGIVVNANCATRAHRDVGDDDYCMVVVVSDCEGGDLVFHELGLVFSARNVSKLGGCLGLRGHRSCSPS